MTQFWRSSAITGTALFLEGAGAYLAIAVFTALTNTVAARLPLWLVLIALTWAFLLSLYIQTIRFSLNLRGIIGLSCSLISLAVLANLNTGMGFLPFARILNGDLQTAFALILTFAFLVGLWWRGSSLAHDEVTLDTVRGAFQWGLVVVVGAVLIDSMVSANIVSGFLVMGFFAVGLLGLSLARFSAESADTQVMSREWFIPIGVAVGAVLLLGLLISGLGLGGLDDVTRAILRVVGTIGGWILKPILLGLGYLAAALVAFGTWLTTVLGGGDLSGLNEAQEQLRRFHESLEDVEGRGLPGWIYTLLKSIAFLIATVLVVWLLFRVFRFRRLLRLSGDVQEVRESLFTWGKANDDLSGLIGGWWNNLVRKATAEEEHIPDPENPRELYHRFLELSDNMGHPKAESETPREHQGGLDDALPPEPVDRIVGGFQGAHYGNRSTGSQEMDGLLQDLATIRQREAEWKEQEKAREADQS